MENNFKKTSGFWRDVLYLKNSKKKIVIFFVKKIDDNDESMP